MIIYEPELFTAIYLKRWSDVHVNLFLTGNVIVLGRKAHERAFEVQRWLLHIEQQPIPQITTDTTTTAQSLSSPYDEAVSRLVSHLPDYYQKLGSAYFRGYPYKLILSWLNQITKEGLADTLIPRLCNQIAHFSS